MLHCFKVPKCNCIGCKKPLEITKGLCNKRPQPGDITICYSCGKVMKFDEDMKLAAVEEERLAEIKGCALWAEIAALQRRLNPPA